MFVEFKGQPKASRVIRDLKAMPHLRAEGRAIGGPSAKDFKAPPSEFQVNGLLPKTIWGAFPFLWVRVQVSCKVSFTGSGTFM